VKAFETPLVGVEQLRSDRRAAVFQMEVPLEKLPPGHYTCQVTVVDDAGGSFGFARFPILIKAPPAPQPAPAATPSGDQ